MGVIATATIALAAGGGAVAVQNTVTVTKVVQGPVPASTTFAVTLTCVPTGLPTTTHVIHFDANGNPTDTNSFSDILDLTTCTATETDSGGASAVSYACELTYGNGDPSHLSQCSSDQAVSFANDVLTDSATLTVTNRFDAPAPTPPTVAPEPVEIQPAAFTG
jgi:hypothetical protein